MKQFPPGLIKQIGVGDWQVLAECPSTHHWRRLFYPEAGGDGRGSAAGRRNKKLLSHVNESVYRDILDHVEDAHGHERVEFPDIARFMKMNRQEGAVLAAVMMHAVDWLNPSPTLIVNRQRSNKPQLRDDLAMAVEGYLRQVQGLEDGFTDQMVTDGCSILEEAILGLAWQQMAFFTTPEGRATLKTRWADDPSYYSRRIRQREAWNRLYTILEALLHPYSPLPWGRDDTTETRVHGDARITTTALAIADLLDKDDWIVGNGVLNNPEASRTLANDIRSQLYRWAIDMHNRAGQPYGSASGHTTSARRPPSSRETLCGGKRSLLDRINDLRQRGRCSVAGTKRKELGLSDLVGQQLAERKRRRRRLTNTPGGNSRVESVTAMSSIRHQAYELEPPPPTSHDVRRQSAMATPAATSRPRRLHSSPPWTVSWSVSSEDEMPRGNQATSNQETSNQEERGDDQRPGEGLGESQGGQGGRARTPRGDEIAREQHNTGRQRRSWSSDSWPEERVFGTPRQREPSAHQETSEVRGRQGHTGEEVRTEAMAQLAVSGRLPREPASVGRPRSRRNDNRVAEPVSAEPVSAELSGGPFSRDSPSPQKADTQDRPGEEQSWRSTASIPPQPYTTRQRSSTPARVAPATARDTIIRKALPERRDSQEAPGQTRSGGVPSRLREMAGAKAFGRVICKQ